MAHILATMRAPAPLVSLAFPTEHAVLLALTGDNRVLSLAAPETAGASSSEDVWTAPEGHVVLAAGWLEGRLAVVSAGHGLLELTHGDCAAEGGASRSARVALGGTALDPSELGPARLDPYVRWWCEVDPIEQQLRALSLVRDRTARLLAIAAWREGAALRSTVTPVAAHVSGLSGSDARRDAVFTGVVGDARGVFALDRRSTGPIRAQLLPGNGSFRTHFAWPSPGAPGAASYALERAPNVWELHGADARATIQLTHGERAVALTARRGTRPAALVVLGTDLRELWLVAQARREQLFRAASAITCAAVHPALPLFAVGVEREVSLSTFAGS